MKDTPADTVKLFYKKISSSRAELQCIFVSQWRKMEDTEAFTGELTKIVSFIIF